MKRKILIWAMALLTATAGLSGCAADEGAANSDPVESAAISGAAQDESGEAAESSVEETEEDDTVYTDEQYFQYYNNDLDHGKIGISGYTGPDTEVVIPKTIDGYTVDFIYQTAFYGNTDITKVVIPDTVTAIHEEAFRDCSNLEEIVLSDSTLSIGYSAFDGTAWYENQPDGMVYVGKVAYTYKCDNMEEITEVEIADGTLGIAERAFHGFVNLSEISVPDSVVSIGSGAFDTTAWLDEGEEDTVLYAGNVAYLYNTRHDSEAVAIELEPGTVAIADSCFSGCEGLYSISLPDGLVRIGRAAFQYTALTTVEIPDSVTTIGGAAFYSCEHLGSITIPESVIYIGLSAFNLSEQVTIHGSRGSEAENYADIDGIRFVEID